MLRRTQEEMAKGTPVICEAAFHFEGLYRAVDILKKQDSGWAMDIFPKIKDMPPDQQQQAYHDLLEYCKLDTYAMVKVWEKLKEAITK